MEIEEIRKEIVVNAGAKRAFDVFTNKIGNWWPFSGHSVSEISGSTAVDVVISPRVGGEITETSAAGERYIWGRVKQWQEGERLVFSWLMGLGEAEASEVEVTFKQEGAQCRVTLVHRYWDGYGAGAQAKRDNYNTGWDKVFCECFAGACAG